MCLPVSFMEVFYMKLKQLFISAGIILAVSITPMLLQTTSFSNPLAVSVSAATTKTTKTDISSVDIKVRGTTYEYTGSAIKPYIEVYLAGQTTPLSSKSDYTVKYTNNINAGTATITVTGKGNYKGKATATFKITPKTLSIEMIRLGEVPKFTGKAVKPKVTVKFPSTTGIKTVSSKNYLITYKDNDAPGKATMTIIGQNNFTGKLNITYTIGIREPKVVKKIITPTQTLLIWKADKNTDYKAEYKIPGAGTNSYSVKYYNGYAYVVADGFMTATSPKVTITANANWSNSSKSITVTCKGFLKSTEYTKKELYTQAEAWIDSQS